MVVRRRLCILALCTSAGCADTAAATGETDSGSTSDDGGLDTESADLDDGSDGDAINPDCRGEPLTANGALDVDLQAVRVTGTVSLAGAELPSTDEDLGAIRFSETRTGATFELPLQSLGPSDDFDVVLGPGIYDLTYLPVAGACGGPSVMPCTQGTLVTDLQLFQDGSLEVEIDRAEAALAVTLNGDPLPIDGPRGELVLTRAGAPAAHVALAPHASGSFSIFVFPDDYAVRYRGNVEACGAGDSPSMPCGSTELVAKAALRNDGALELDVVSIEVNGSVSLDGEPMPTSTVDRGRVRLSSEDGEPAASKPFERSGPATYALSLVPGTYAAHYEAPASACFEDPVIPCGGGQIAAAQSFSQSGSWSLDIPTARVEGAVTLNGAPLPDGDLDRGVLAFQPDSGETATTEPLGARGPGSYGLTVVAGSFDVRYQGDPGACADDRPVPAMPCMEGSVAEGVMITQSGSLDVDIPAVTARGAITLAGDALPDSDWDRGALVFETKGGSASVPLGADGPRDYAIRLLAGAYDVAFEGNPESCAAGEPSALPCVGGPVHTQIDLRQDGSLDVDLTSVRVQGNVTLAGEALPTAVDARGHLEFISAGGHGATPTEAFGASGSFAYAVSLMPGHYIVRHAANPALCATQHDTAVPCGPQVPLGCPDE